MKKTMSFLILMMTISLSAFTQSIDSSEAHVVSVSSNYSTMVLIFLSLLGVCCHLLNDLIKEKQKPAPYVYSWSNYWSAAWPSKMLSVAICIGVIVVRHEMMQIPDFTNWEGIAMFAIGYFGGSILVPLFNSIQKRTGIDPNS